MEMQIDMTQPDWEARYVAWVTSLTDEQRAEMNWEFHVQPGARMMVTVEVPSDDD